MEQDFSKKLIDKAKEFSERAYCPYSDNPIGACVFTQNGMIFGGCNVESVALNGSIGALEVALCKAVSEGCTNIRAVALFCQGGIVYPSGSERQLLKEFSNTATIYCATVDKCEQFTIQELLPYSKEK